MLDKMLQGDRKDVVGQDRVVCVVQREGARTAVVFAILGYHEHHFPLEDIVIHKTTTYPIEVFRVLHIFELAGEETSCACYSGGVVCHGGWLYSGVHNCRVGGEEYGKVSSQIWQEASELYCSRARE